MFKSKSLVDSVLIIKPRVAAFDNYAIARTPALCTAVAKWKSLLKGPVIPEEVELDGGKKDPSAKSHDVKQGAASEENNPTAPNSNDVKLGDAGDVNKDAVSKVAGGDKTAGGVNASSPRSESTLSTEDKDDPTCKQKPTGRNGRGIPTKNGGTMSGQNKPIKMTRKGSAITNQNKNVSEGLRKKTPSQRESGNNVPKKKYITRATAKQRSNLRATNNRKTGKPGEPPLKGTGGKIKGGPPVGKQGRRDVAGSSCKMNSSIKKAPGRLAWRSNSEEQEELLKEYDHDRSSSSTTPTPGKNPADSETPGNSTGQVQVNVPDGGGEAKNGEGLAAGGHGGEAAERPTSAPVYGQIVEHDKKEEVVILEKEWVDHKYIAAIPCIPLSLAVVCLILNIVAPGTGTIISSFSVFCCMKQKCDAAQGKKESTVDLMITNFCVGISQLFTVTFFFIGFLWSVTWGIFMVQFAYTQYKKEKEEKERLAAISVANAFLRPGVFPR